MQTGETFKKLTLSASIQHASEHGYIKWTGSSQECKTLKITPYQSFVEAFYKNSDNLCFE